ncbi:MAG: hypothetical protein ABIT01_00510 [Thermoanaerobaculia bacterium]
MSDRNGFDPQAGCPELGATRRALEARETDTLGPLQERRLKAHLKECSDCAAEGLADDPTLLFFSLAASSDPEPLEGARTRSVENEGRAIATDVMAALEIERARRRVQPARRPAMLRAASVALLASALLALLVATGQIPFLAPSHAARDLQARSGSPAASPAAPPGPVGGSVGRSLELSVDDASLAGSRGQAAVRRPLIEGLENPGARVYQFASDSPKEPNVVFVVDRNADL